MADSGVLNEWKTLSFGNISRFQTLKGDIKNNSISMK